MEWFTREQELVYRYFIVAARRWWEEEKKHSKDAHRLEREMGLAIDELDKIGWPPIGKLASLAKAAEEAYRRAKRQCGEHNPNENPECYRALGYSTRCTACPMEWIAEIEEALKDLGEEGSV